MWPQSITICSALRNMAMTSGKREDQMSPKNREAEQKAAKAAPALTNHYRAIGPAAVVAALICAPKNKPVKAIKPA